LYSTNIVTSFIKNDDKILILKRSDKVKSMKCLWAGVSGIIEKNEGEIIKIDDWGLLNLSHEINKNKRGNYIHFKLKGSGLTVSELEKNEKIDNNLLRFLTVRVKKFDLDKNYFKQETNSDKEVKEKNRKNDK